MTEPTTKAEPATKTKPPNKVVSVPARLVAAWLRGEQEATAS